MKVIDAMQKVATGEIFDFRINDDNYYVDKSNYICKEDGSKVEWFIDDEWLNEEVEIIKEDKKIKHIDLFDYYTGYEYESIKELSKHLEMNFEELNTKINELIDELNKLKEKK